MKLLTTLGVGFVGFVMVLIPVSVNAASITITPLRQEISLAPGQAIDKTLTITNTGITFTAGKEMDYLSVKDIVVKNAASYMAGY